MIWQSLKLKMVLFSFRVLHYPHCIIIVVAIELSNRTPQTSFFFSFFFLWQRKPAYFCIMSFSAHVSVKLTNGPLSCKEAKQSPPCNFLSFYCSSPKGGYGMYWLPVALLLYWVALHSTGAAWGGVCVKLKQRNAESPHRPSQGYTRGCAASNLIPSTLCDFTVHWNSYYFSAGSSLRFNRSFHLPEISVNLRAVNVLNSWGFVLDLPLLLFSPPPPAPFHYH